MNVQPERALEQRLGDQQAVRGDDHRVDVLDLWPLRLEHARPEPLGDGLRGRRARPPAPRSRVRTGQNERDVVSRRKPLEHLRAERRGRGDADALHVSRAERGSAAAAASPAPACVPRPSFGRGSACRRDGRAVLDDRARRAFELQCHVGARLVLPFEASRAGSAPREPGRPAATGSPRRRPRSRCFVAVIVGLTTASTSSSPRWNTNTRCRIPTCVAASPTPRASCMS